MIKLQNKENNFIKIAESLGDVHTCSFKGLTNNAIFAFINNVYKKDNL